MLSCLVLPLTTTLKLNTFKPSSQMRKRKLSEDGNLPMRRWGRRKGIILYQKRCFYGSNSDIVSHACCLLPFPNLLHTKTKSSGLLPYILSGHFTWFLRSWTSVEDASVIGSLGLHLFTYWLDGLDIWQVWNEDNAEIFFRKSMYTWH